MFRWLQDGGKIENDEMLRTFNCGVGLVIAVANEQADQALSAFKAKGVDAWQIGRITEQASEDAGTEAYVAYSGKLA